MSTTTSSTGRRDVAAAVAGILLGVLAATGFASMRGSGAAETACVESVTGRVIPGNGCAMPLVLDEPARARREQAMAAR